MRDEKNPPYIPPNKFGGKTELRKFFEKHIFTHSSSDTIFNQYQDNVEGIDRRDGAKIRRENLFSYLSSFKRKPPILLLGEAPGPWGCRFSGIPFTGEGPLSRGELPFTGKQTSANDTPYSERSGTVFWDLLAQYHPSFFVWNTIPFHPHQPDELLSVRNPKWSEVKAHLPLLQELLEILQPKQIAAIGRIAEKALHTIEQECVYVRHPSYGGVKLFRDGMERLFTKS